MLSILNDDPEEILRYGKPEHVSDALARALENLADQQEKARQTDRDLERACEQVYFARELLDELRVALAHAKSLRDYRKAFTRIIETSSFEE